jgi:hypothetical protein
MATIVPPTPAQLASAGLSIVPNLVSTIESNGDHARVWDSTTKTFPLATSKTPYNTQLYAVNGSWITPKLIVSSDGSLAASPLGSTKL